MPRASRSTHDAPRRLSAITAFALTALAPWPHGPAAAQARPQPRTDVPVVIGGDADADACGATGQVVGLDPRGDGFLSVRSGPGGRAYRELARLHNGRPVHICGERGPWLAVVYPGRRGASADCGVSSPWPVRRAYTGPCASGWVHRRYVRLVAG
jgi:hypothetical protein